jgi:hypothetical protein
MAISKQTRALTIMCFLTFAITTSEAAVSPAEQTAMLETHNMYRCIHGVPPLTWDASLAKTAQSWADTGTIQHSTALGAFKKYGENMKFDCPTSSVCKATKWWYAEISKYTESSPFQAAHYTQMVWKGTTKMGCGKGKTTSPCKGEVWFCQFSPPGNYFGKYKENVLPASKDKATCGWAKWGGRLYSSDVPNVGFAQGSTMLGAAAFFAVTAFFTVVAGFYLRQRAATLAAYEGLELEPLEAGGDALTLE